MHQPENIVYLFNIFIKSTKSLTSNKSSVTERHKGKEGKQLSTLHVLHVKILLHITIILYIILSHFLYTFSLWCNLNILFSHNVFFNHFKYERKVKCVYKDHNGKDQKVVSIDKWSLFTTKFVL